MSLEKPTITKTTNETRLALQRASAWGLPNRPSERGMKAEDIKKAFWKPFLDANGSLLKELDRVVDEINVLVAARYENGEATEVLATEAKTVIGAINEAFATIVDHNALVVDGEELLLELDPHHIQKELRPIKTMLNQLENGYRQDLSPRVETVEQKISEDLEPTVEAHGNALISARQNAAVMNIKLVGLRAEVEGIARSYVLPDFPSFMEFIKGRSTIVIAENRDGAGDAEEIEIGVEDLKTGDNIILVEHEVSDFWFEKTTGYDNYQRRERYTYKGEEYWLDCYTFDSGIFGGLMHVAEADYTVIERYAYSADVSAGVAEEKATAAAESATDAAKSATESKKIKEEAEAMVDGVIKLPAIYVKDGSLCVDAPRVATVVEGTLVFRQGDDCPPDKVDKVTPLAGKEYTVAAVYKNGTATSLAADIGTYGGAIPLRDYYGRLRVGTTATMEDHHAASVGYLGKRLEDYVKKIDVDELVGDIETALDNIIAMQNSLIGGGVE